MAGGEAVLAHGCRGMLAKSVDIRVKTRAADLVTARRRDSSVPVSGIAWRRRARSAAARALTRLAVNQRIAGACIAAAAAHKARSPASWARSIALSSIILANSVAVMSPSASTMRGSHHRKLKGR